MILCKVDIFHILDFSLEENPKSEKYIDQIRSQEDATPVTFAINKNLFVMVKIVNCKCKCP